MTTDDICDLIDKMRRHLYALDKDKPYRKGKKIKPWQIHKKQR